MEEEKVLGSEVIYNGKLFDIRIDTIELQGQRHKREIVQHHGAVAVIPIDADGNVIMVRQFRSGNRETMLEIPAGGIEPEEEPEAAARRELQEEIGMYPDELVKLGGYWVAAAYNTEYITIYLCRTMHESAKAADSGEVIDIERLPFTEALEKAHNGEFQDAKTVIGLLWAERHLNNK